MTDELNIQEAAFAKEKLAQVLKVIEKHESQLGWHISDQPANRVEDVIRRYERNAVNSMAGAKAFRDEVLVVFQALKLIGEMVGNASTHSEKNARLRGLVEMLESSVTKLRQAEFDFIRNWYSISDVFRTDYPTRHMMETIRRQEDEIRRLKVATGELTESPAQVDELGF